MLTSAPFRTRKPPRLLVERADRLHLATELGLVGAARHRQVAGVIGDRDVLAARGACGARHRLDRVGAVGPVGLGLEIAAQGAVLDQPRQAARAGGLDLALVLAQLGRDVRQVEARVDLLLGAAGDRRVAAKEAVLVQLEPFSMASWRSATLCALLPGEVVQRGAEALARARRAVELESGARAARSSLVSPAEDARRPRAALTNVHDRSPAGARRSARSASPTVSRRRRIEPAITGVSTPGIAASRRARSSTTGRTVASRWRPPEAATVVSARRMFCSLRSPKRASAADLARSRGGGQILDRADTERLVEDPHGLRSDALERGEPGDVDREPGAILLVQPAPAGGEELFQLLRHRGADARDRAQPLRPVLGVDLGQRAILGLDGLGGLLVRARLELDLVHFEVGGEVAEDSRERSVVHDVDASRGTPRATGSPGRAAPAGPSARSRGCSGPRRGR